MSYQRILCIDFDGVIHAYTTPWGGADVIFDDPVPGAIDWLIELVKSEDFHVCIYSSRSREESGIHAMENWLLSHGMPFRILTEIGFPTQKPAAFLTIDDRAICFDGNFPTQDTMKDFKPWNKKGV